MKEDAPTFFSTAAEFAVWLDAHASTAKELAVGFHKVKTGHACMTWSESVDEALCRGWIDGVRNRIDDHAYMIRFTPRKPTSIWSAINIAKVEALISSGRMRADGLRAYEARQAAKSGVYSHERTEAPELSAVEMRTFQQQTNAWAFFESCPPGYRKRALHVVVSAKKQETRERRLARLIDASSRGERLND